MQQLWSSMRCVTGETLSKADGACIFSYFRGHNGILFSSRTVKSVPDIITLVWLGETDKNTLCWKRFGRWNCDVHAWSTRSSAYSTSPFRGYREVMQCSLVSNLNSCQFNLLLCRLNPDSKNTHRLQKPPLTKNQQGHRKSIEVWKTTYFNSVTPNSMDYGCWAFLLLLLLFILDRFNKDPR